MKRPCLFLLSLLASSLAAFSAESLDTILAKARARVGSDEAIAAVKSVHYLGTMETVAITPEGPKPEKADVEIIYQKPLQHRLTIKRPASQEITGLDEYRAWRQLRVTGDKPRSQVVALGKQDVQRLRADTWESMSFFRGLVERGGQIIDLGEATIDGATCRKVTFRYGPGIEYTRYFRESDGRLVLTETGTSVTIREEGDVVVEGVRFPQKIVQTIKSADGKERVYTIHLDKVALNQAFPPTLFEQPFPASEK